MAGVGQRAREHHVAVEDRAHGIRDRLIHVIAVDQHGVQRGDRSARAGARALEQPWEQREHAGGVATCRRWLTDCEPHRSRYWLNAKPDPQKEEKIRALCALYRQAQDDAARGQLTFSVDEMTGI